MFRVAIPTGSKLLALLLYMVNIVIHETGTNYWNLKVQFDLNFKCVFIFDIVFGL